MSDVVAHDEAPLQYLAQVQYGMGQPPPLNEDGVPILRATNIERGKITTRNLQRARVEDLPLDRAPLLRDGEVLVVRSGAYTGDSALVTSEWAGSAPGYDLRVTPDPALVEPRFLAWSLLSTYCLDQFNLVKLRAAQAHLNADELAATKVPLASLEAQRRIADMLDAETARIDTLIEKNERVLDLLATREARVLEDEIYGPGSIAVGIHYLATYVNGYPFKPEDRSDEGTPIIRIAQLLGDTRQQDYYAGTPDPYCHIDSGDLIFSWSATLAARIWDGGPAFLNQHLFKVEPHGDVYRDWLLHALNAAVPRMKSMTHGSTMTHITRPMMTKVRVPKPTLDEQRRIAASIRSQFDRLAALRAKVDRQQELLRTRRQALITAAVTGEIEI